MAYSYVTVTHPVTKEKMNISKHMYLCLLKDGLWVKGICHTPPGYEVHHIDFNKKNNAPENLEMITDEEHRRKHWEHDAKRRQHLDDIRKLSYTKVSRHDTLVKRWDEGKKRTIFHIWDGDKEIATYEGWKAAIAGTGLSATKIGMIMREHTYTYRPERHTYPYRITSESRR